jgi:hypothetical protein
MKIKIPSASQVPVAHACNPSCSGDRGGLQFEAKPSLKRASAVAQGAGPEFKPQYYHKKNKKYSAAHS